MADPWASLDEDVKSGSASTQPAKKTVASATTTKDDPWASLDEDVKGGSASTGGLKKLTDAQASEISDKDLMSFDASKYDLTPEQRDYLAERTMRVLHVGDSSEESMANYKANTGGAVRGAVQGISSIPALANDAVTWVQNLFRKDGDKLPYTSQVQNQMMTQLGVPEANTPTSRMIQAGAAGATGAATGIGAGNLIKAAGSGVPTASGSMAQAVGQSMATQPAQQIAAGTSAGLASQATAENTDNPWLQTGAGLAASLAAGGLTASGQRIASAARGEGAAIPQDQMVQDAANAGGKLMTSDVFPPKGPLGTLAQNLVEKNPFFGTSAMRTAQQADRVTSVESLLRDYGAEDLSGLSDSVQKDLASNRKGIRFDLQDTKNNIISDLDKTGPPVPVNNAITAIDAGISKMKGLGTTAATGVISQLEDWKAALADKNLSAIETLRSKVIGNAFQDPSQPQVSALGQDAMNSVYGALRKDIEGYVQSNAGPDALAQWQKANAGLKDSINDLKVTALKTALTKGDSSINAIQNVLFSSDPATVQTLYKNLSPEGRANARAAILAKAGEQALTSGTDTISPEKFATAVQKLGGPVGVFFSGDDKAQVEGLMRYLNATRQATKATLNAPTGQQLLAPLAVTSTGGGLGAMFGGGVAGGLEAAGATAASLSTIGGLSRLYESAPVRDGLIALARAKPGTTDETALLKRIGAAVTAQQNVTSQKDQQVPQNPLYKQAVASEPNVMTQEQFAEKYNLPQSPSTAKRYDVYLRSLRGAQ